MAAALNSVLVTVLVFAVVLFPISTAAATQDSLAARSFRERKGRGAVMAGLQRSVVSFRRQGSSGLVWDDKLVTEELNKPPAEREIEGGDGECSEAAEVKAAARNNIPPIKIIERSRSNRGGGRGFRSKETASPAVEPPSPRVSACGLCSGFGKSGGRKPRAKGGKRRSRV